MGNAASPKSLRAFAPWLFAMLAGLLWAMSFPKWHAHIFAWFAPGLLLLAALPFRDRSQLSPDASRTQKVFRLGLFQLGYIAGLVHYLVSLYWLLFIPFPAGAVAGWIALSAYLAVYPAAWTLLCARLLPRALPVEANPYREFIRALGALTGLQRSIWALQCAALWVGGEMIVARLFTGFPWDLLGVSQFANVPLIQVSAVTGVYGVSFLLVWFSVSLLCALAALAQKLRQKREPTLILSPMPVVSDLVLPLAVTIAVFLHGFYKTVRPLPTGQTVKAALIQPSIPQTLIWDPSQNAYRFDQLMALSERALAHKPDLIVWPEAAVPEMLRADPDTAKRVRALAIQHQVWMIIGADDAVPRFPEAQTARDYDFYNSSFAISPEGDITGVYRKRRLVMFGEYVPLVKYLPFLKYITPIGDAGFSPGKAPAPFTLTNLNATVSVLICFEDAFPHLGREYVDKDTDFLLNLTNNGWFGESAAQWQHAATAVFRAVENGIALVRCSNNGLTCWVDPHGRMQNVFFDNSRNVYQAGFKLVEAPLLREDSTRQLTFYTRHGDVFGWSCFAFGALASLRPRKRGNS